MKRERISYEELSKRLAEAEAALDSIRKGKVDAIVGENEPLVIRMKSLVEENERLVKEWQTTFDSVTDSIMIIDREQNILRCNRATLDMFKVTAGETAGKKCYEIVHGSSSEPPCDCPFLRSEKSIKREKKEVQVSGRYYEITVDPIVSSKDEISGAVHIISDVTQRKINEYNLKLSEERHRLITLLVSDYLYSFIVTPDKTLKGEWVSDSFVKVFGFSIEEIDSRGGWQSMVYPDDLPGMILHARKVISGEPDIVEVRFVTRQGEIRWIKDYAAPAWDENRQNVTRVYGAAQDITDQKKAEAAIRESELKYKAIFNSTGTATLIVNEDFTIAMANKECFLVTGFSPEELIGKKWTQFAAPESLEEMMKYHLLRRKDPSLAPQKYEVTLINKKNEKRHVILDIGMIPGTSQSVVSMLDITEHKEAEAARLKSEEDFRRLFEDHAAVKLIIDPESGNIMDANAAAASFYGWTRDELKRMKIQQINTLPPEVVKSEMEKVKKNKRILFEFQHRLADGSVKDVEVYSSAINMKGGTYLHSIIHDITEKKAIEKALQQSEENFKRSVAELPIGIRIVDEGGNTIYANRSFLNIHGFDNLEEFNNTPSKLRYTPESYLQHQERKEKRKKGEVIADYEIEIVRKDGETRRIKVFRNEIIWNGKKHFQVINQDITNEHKLKLELIAAKDKAEESLRLKSAFLANISHEIRTPLNGILGFSELLRYPALNDEEKETYLTMLKESGERMLNTINQIIEMSKIETGIISVDYENVYVKNLVSYLYNFFKPEAEKKGLTLSLVNKIPDELIISTDKYKFESVVGNLLKNAIKFTVHGSVELVVEKGIKEIIFSVKDTGPGIEPSMHEKIFERFVQADTSLSRSYEGAGLGLSIAKSYAGFLGGKIRLESEVGKGSIFSFILPLKQPGMAGMKNNNIYPEDTVADAEGKTILVAEDDDLNYLYIETLLKRNGFNVLRAVNGDEAVKLCSENPDIELVLMDIKMPGMNGHEATRKIREFNPGLPILAQTAFAHDSDRISALENGCNDYISKPFTMNLLLSKINNLLKKE